MLRAYTSLIIIIACLLAAGCVPCPAPVRGNYSFPIHYSNVSMPQCAEDCAWDAQSLNCSTSVLATSCTGDCTCYLEDCASNQPLTVRACG